MLFEEKQHAAQLQQVKGLQQGQLITLVVGILRDPREFSAFEVHNLLRNGAGACVEIRNHRYIARVEIGARIAAALAVSASAAAIALATFPALTR